MLAVTISGHCNLNAGRWVKLLFPRAQKSPFHMKRKPATPMRWFGIPEDMRREAKVEQLSCRLQAKTNEKSEKSAKASKTKSESSSSQSSAAPKVQTRAAARKAAEADAAKLA